MIGRTRRFGIFSAAAALALVAGAPLVAEPKQSEDDRDTLTLNVYTLETCPISGAKLGSMGDPVIKQYEHDGEQREVRFCCAGCTGGFEEDMEAKFKEIDQQLIEQQLPHYALDACPVSGRSLEDVDEPVNMIHEGRLVRFCCDRCPVRFKRDPARYMSKLDEAVIKQQRENYPLDTCVVGKMELGSMGEPHEIIVGGTLVRFCCAGCVDGFKENPADHLATIRNAWAEHHEDHD